MVSAKLTISPVLIKTQCVLKGSYILSLWDAVHWVVAAEAPSETSFFELKVWYQKIFESFEGSGVRPPDHRFLEVDGNCDRDLPFDRKAPLYASFEIVAAIAAIKLRNYIN